MSAARIIEDLASRGINLSVRDGNIHGPKRLMDADRERIRQHKSELVRLLSGECPKCGGVLFVSSGMGWRSFGCGTHYYKLVNLRAASGGRMGKFKPDLITHHRCEVGCDSIVRFINGQGYCRSCGVNQRIRVEEQRI